LDEIGRDGQLLPRLAKRGLPRCLPVLEQTAGEGDLTAVAADVNRPLDERHMRDTRAGVDEDEYGGRAQLLRACCVRLLLPPLEGSPDVVEADCGPGRRRH